MLLPTKEKEPQVIRKNIKRLEVSLRWQHKSRNNRTEPTPPISMNLSDSTQVIEPSSTQGHDLLEQYIALKRYSAYQACSSPRLRENETLSGMKYLGLKKLRVDLYDELLRRQRLEIAVGISPPFLRPVDTYLSERNRARKSMSEFSNDHFADLVEDLLFELERREPSLTDSRTNMSEENLAAFKRIAWVSTETEENPPSASDPADISLLQALIYSWAPRRSRYRVNRHGEKVLEAEEILSTTQVLIAPYFTSTKSCLYSP